VVPQAQSILPEYLIDVGGKMMEVWFHMIVVIVAIKAYRLAKLPLRRRGKQHLSAFVNLTESQLAWATDVFPLTQARYASRKWEKLSILLETKYKLMPMQSGPIRNAMFSYWKTIGLVGEKSPYIANKPKNPHHQRGMAAYANDEKMYVHLSS
jgi:hypothetical protein